MSTPQESTLAEAGPLPFNLDELAQILYSAVVSDSCDRHGRRAQVMRAGLEPVLPEAPVLVGWARTVRSVRVDEPPQRHYGAEIDFIDSLLPNDVVVVQADDAHSGVWGELFSTASTGRGARGAVVDGFVRDQLKIQSLGFPVHAAGANPADSLGRLSMADADQEISIRGVQVRSGDLVVADLDGVVVVPREVAVDVVAYAVEKASIENRARDLLLGGGKLADVWEKFRVL